jgi:hypothetical protein
MANTPEIRLRIRITPRIFDKVRNPSEPCLRGPGKGCVMEKNGDEKSSECTVPLKDLSGQELTRVKSHINRYESLERYSTGVNFLTLRQLLF